MRRFILFCILSVVLILVGAFFAIAGIRWDAPRLQGWPWILIGLGVVLLAVLTFAAWAHWRDNKASQLMELDGVPPPPRRHKGAADV